MTAWEPAVGDLVAVRGAAGVARVVRLGGDMGVWAQLDRILARWEFWRPCDLRPATPEEQAKAQLGFQVGQDVDLGDL